MPDRPPLEQAEPEYGPVFGLLTPQANTTVEPEMQLLLPGTVLAARCTSASADARQRLIDYLEHLAATLAQFDLAPVRVAGFACTGSGYLAGHRREDQHIAALTARAGCRVITATQAIRRCLELLGAHRIAVLSPYPAWLSSAAHAYWSDTGYTVTATAGLPAELLDTRSIYALTSARVQQLLQSLNRDGCDAVLLSGTGMPSLRSLASLPSSPPVLSSNVCLAWAMLAAVAPAWDNAQALRAFLGPDAAWRQRLRDRQDSA